MKVYVFGFNMILLSSPYRVPRPSYPFRRKFGRSGKGSFTEKLKSLIEVPNVVHVKVHALSFNMIGKAKGRSPKKLKILIEVP